MKISKERLVKSISNVMAGRQHRSERWIQQLKVFIGKVTLEHWRKHELEGAESAVAATVECGHGLKHRDWKWLEVTS